MILGFLGTVMLKVHDFIRVQLENIYRVATFVFSPLPHFDVIFPHGFPHKNYTLFHALFVEISREI